MVADGGKPVHSGAKLLPAFTPERNPYPILVMYAHDLMRSNTREAK
jgi:hypothetical protein